MQDARQVDGTRRVRLGEIDPAAAGSLTKADAEQRLVTLSDEVRRLQELMYAAGTNGLLVVLQGMDAAGKDVTIGNVFDAANPQSCRVEAFKAPTAQEEAHHFLWRFDHATPARGELVIFDRSYYEEVLVPQVHGELSAAATHRRFEHVNAFERLLIDEGTIVIKFFLHISNGEQERRLRERQDNGDTAWKITASDWTERRSWDAYMLAYEETINACCSADAPWYVVPSDHQWFHNLAVADVLVERLRPYRDDWFEARNHRGEEARTAAERVHAEAN